MRKKTTDTEALIAEGAELNETITTAKQRVVEIEGILLSELSPGRHNGNGDTGCTIVGSSSSIKLNKDDIESVKELAGEEAFKKLFERGVTFKPVKAFRQVLAAVVKKRPANGILKLVEKSSNAYVKW